MTAPSDDARPEDRVRALTERYSAQAHAYRDYWAPLLHQAARGLLREVPAARVASVLDLGTGVGTLLTDLQALYPGATVVGVDRSLGMVRLARSDLPRLVMDAACLAFPSRSFDLVLLAFVLFHLADPALGLAEARRVLRPDGWIASATWQTELESPAMRIWSEELDAHDAPPLDDSKDLARHDLVDTPEKVAALLERAGFRAIRTWPAPLEHAFDREHLLRLRTGVGRQKTRFDSLDEAARISCLERATLRFAALGPEDFIARGTVVYAIGHG